MSDPTDQFAAMSREQLNGFFRTSDILEVTETIRSLSDEGLRSLIELEHFRSEGVVAILDRFEELADAERLAEISGVVRFELSRSRKDTERHTVRFDAGGVTLDPQAEPDVTIAADIVDFVRLVTGQANAALLYLGAALTIEGDQMLALAVGSVFTLPGSDRAAVDPSALDPVDVATAVATTSARHMRSVMEGSFRPIVLEEVFRRFPEFIDREKAGDLCLSVGLRIGGRADGQVDRYVVHVADGVCSIETGAAEGQRRDATITVEGADFLRLATGQLHPVRGVLTGALKVKGDRTKALALNAVMVPPRPRKT